MIRKICVNTFFSDLHFPVSVKLTFLKRINLLIFPWRDFDWAWGSKMFGGGQTNSFHKTWFTCVKEIKLTVHKKWSFPLRISSVNWPNPQFPADLVIFTEEIPNRKLHFLCIISKYLDIRKFTKCKMYTSVNKNCWYQQFCLQKASF